MGKLKLKEALMYSQIKETMNNKKNSTDSFEKKPKHQVKKVQQESEDEDDDSEEEDEDEEEEEEKDLIQIPDHPLSKKELRKLKKELEKEGLSLEDLEKDLEDEEEEDDDEEDSGRLDTKKLIESDSESESEFEEFSNKIERPKRSKKSKKEEEEEEGEEEEEDVELENAELDDDADVIPFQKLTVNNKAALQQALHSIQLPKTGLKFIEHLSVTSSFAQAKEIKDVFDDYARELSFVKQAKEAAELARAQLKKDNVPFSRPTDYFAEMIKSDEHMDKIKQKMIDEETDKRARGDARRQRELKKFGKKVQNAKLQERQKEKRDTLDKIQSLKRKRAGNEITTEDFDIAVEEATAAQSEFQGQRGRNGGKPNGKRQAKDQKYGFGGKKKFKKSNDAQSTGDMSDYNRRVKANKAARQGGAKPKRPGKSKRQQRR